MNTGTDSAGELLLLELRAWHERVRRSDDASDPTLNDPAPYAVVQLVAAGSAGVLGEVVLTGRHAEDLASLAAGVLGGYATSTPWAIAQSLAGYADRPGAVVVDLVVCDAARAEQGRVSLSAAGAAALGDKLALGTMWAAAEDAMVRMSSPWREGDRVRVVDEARGGAARGRAGVVTRVKMSDPTPLPPGRTNLDRIADELAATTAADLAGEDLPPSFWFDVRLDDDTSGYVQTFTTDELVDDD